MKTFKEIKKGDKLFIVTTGDDIKGHIDIVAYTALSDYMPAAYGTSISGVKISTKEGIIIIPAGPDDTSLEMTFTELEEAEKAAYTLSEELLKSMNANMNKKLNEAFGIHDDIVVLTMKRANWKVKDAK